MPQTVQEVVINASIERVYATIVDYQRYPEFLSHLKTVVVESRQQNIAIVRFELELIMRVAYTLRLCEEAPCRVQWTLAAGKMLTKSNGGWRLVAQGTQTHATYSLDIELQGRLPSVVHKRLLASTLPQTLECFKTRAESLI